MKGNEQTFPSTETRRLHTCEYGKYHPGLTKREWFAGMAMQGMLSRYGDDGDDERLCNACYRMADAMCEEKEGGK